MVLQRQGEHFCLSCYTASGENMNTNHACYIMSRHGMSCRSRRLLSCHGVAWRGMQREGDGEEDFCVCVREGRGGRIKGLFNAENRLLKHQIYGSDTENNNIISKVE